MVWKIELEGWTRVASPVVTTYTFVSEFTPGDTVNAQYYRDRLITPFDFSVSMFSGGNIGGKVDVGAARVVVDNTDGALDWMANQQFEGKTASVYRDGTLIFVGIVSSIVVGFEVNVTLSARTIPEDKLLQTSSYLGTGGAEGAAEVKDRKKPLAFGKGVVQCEPVLIDGPNLVYQLESRGRAFVPSVMDGGAALTWDGVYHASTNALIAASIQPGYFSFCDTHGTIRLGARPGSVITASFLLSYGSTTTQALNDLFSVAGVSATIMPYASPASTMLNMPLSYYYDGSEDKTLNEALDEMLSGLLFYYYQDYTSTSPVWIVGTLTAPATGGFPIDERDILDIQPQETGRILKSVTLKYGKNWRPLQPAEIAQSVSAANRKTLSQEAYYYKTSTTPMSWWAETATDETFDTSAFDAITYIPLIGGFYTSAFGTNRQALTITVPLGLTKGGTELIENIRVGYPITVSHPRFGLSGGKYFTVFGFSINSAADTLTITLWG